MSEEEREVTVKEKQYVELLKSASRIPELQKRIEELQRELSPIRGEKKGKEGSGTAPKEGRKEAYAVCDGCGRTFTREEFNTYTACPACGETSATEI